MGQGLAVGASMGTAAVAGLHAPMMWGFYECGLAMCAGSIGGLAVDFLSDCAAKKGKVLIDRESVLAAQDDLAHVYSFYGTNGCYKITSAIKQKHEFLVLESKQRRYFCVQKCPKNGNLMLEMRSNLRQAIDCGLREANQPMLSGETRMKRRDQEFDLPDDLQLAYVIAWLRKEDPRWSFTTENSRHFAVKLRTALNDF